ncbi:MAG: glycosyltransferase family 2 protein [Patescibacteria group bacterium]
MDLSIIIVSFNTQGLLRNCLYSVYEGLKNSPFSFEVIVVDNVSTDGTRPMLKKEFPQVRTLLNQENVGFGRANNQGIKIAKGEYILLLNSDTIVLGEALTKLLIFAKSHPHSFVGPKLLNPDRSPQTSCGPFLTLLVVFAALFLRGDRWGLTRWSPATTRQVDWVSGAALLGPRALFLADLLFDEKIFMYMEELDLLYRAQKKGYLTYFYPEAQIVHLGSGSSQNKKKGPVLNIYRGLIYFYQKHHGLLALLVLKLLLKLKARVSWFLGILTGNSYLRETYAEAYRLV